VLGQTHARVNAPNDNAGVDVDGGGDGDAAGVDVDAGFGTGIAQGAFAAPGCESTCALQVFASLRRRRAPVR
jgi:hypothetical protein